MFDNMTPYRPYVKIYCEDEMTEFLFSELIKSYQRVSPSVKVIDYKIIPIHLGCKQMISLPEFDSNFKEVLIVVDGDTKTEAKKLLYSYVTNDETKIKGIQSKDLLDNVIALPTFLAPESFIYYIVNEVANNESYNHFWRDIEQIPEAVLYTKSRINSILGEVDIKENTSNDDIKSMRDLEELKEFIVQTQLFNFLMKEEKFIELNSLSSKIFSQIEILSKREKSRNF
ncbi:hypothetical protein ACVV62_04360 [Streptococcus pluranimalium]